MAQTVEELAALLEEIKAEADSNAEKFEKLLAGLSGKLEVLANNSESENIMKEHLDEIKKILQSRYAYITAQFDRVDNAITYLTNDTKKIIKVDQVRELFDTFTKYITNIAQELANQKAIILSHTEIFDNFLNNTTDKNDIINAVTSFETDLKGNIKDISEDLFAINEALDDIKTNMLPFSMGNDLNKKLSALKKMISTNVTTRDEKFAALEEKLNEYISNLGQITTNSDVKIGNSVSEITDLKNEIDEIAKDIKKLGSLPQDESGTVLVNSVTEKLEDIGKSITTLQQSVTDGINEELKKNSELVETQINNLVNIIENFKPVTTEVQTTEGTTIDLETPLKEVKDKITAVKQEINLVNTDILDTLNSKTEALILELTPLKNAIQSIAESLSTTNFGGNIDDAENNNDDIDTDEFMSGIKSFIEDIKITIDNRFFELSKVYDRTNELEDIINNTSKISEDTELLLEGTTRISEDTDKLLGDTDKLLGDTTNILTETKRINNSGNKIYHLLDVLNEKVDIIANTTDDGVLDEIDEVKSLISSQRSLIAKADNEVKIGEVQKNLEDLVQKIDTIETTDLKDMRESILTTILNVFEQISFIEESEDIKDFVEEKTDEINQSLTEVKRQLKQITNNDNEDYVYTLQDVESDIAKLRLVLNEISNTSSNEEISDISDNIHRIVSSVEEMQSSLTPEQMADLKSNFERLSEDVLSISSRTNKLLLSSDESYQSLHDSLNDFSSVIGKLEDRLTYLDNKEISERIEQKLDNALTLVSESANSDKVMRQALGYMGEWIDGANENIEKIDEIQEIITVLQDKVPEHSQMLNILSEKFDEQQERMDRLEMKLEKILSAIDDIDDSKLNKKVDKIDKQLAKLSTNIEKLTSYVDE